MSELDLNIEKILIVGATGKTGRRVYQLLSEQIPAQRIKAASRHSDVHFDWQDSETWHAALEDVSHVYLVYSPDLAVPGSTDHILAFCTMAKRYNVAHITLLSGRGEPVAQSCEDILINSGLSWTIVRASWFNQNFSDGLFKSFIDKSLIALPVNNVKEPFVDIDDIAEIVNQSLLTTKHQNKLYEVTGPELLSFKDIADQFTEVLAKPIGFQKLSPMEFESVMSTAKVPEDVTSLLSFLFTEVLDGRNESITNGVEQALGRKPKSFKRFIEDNKDQFGALQC